MLTVIDYNFLLKHLEIMTMKAGHKKNFCLVKLGSILSSQCNKMIDKWVAIN